MIESGYPGFVSDTFNALFAPAGTPADIVEKLVQSSQAAMQRPEALDAARKAGFQIVASRPEQLARRVVTEIQGVKELVARAGISRGCILRRRTRRYPWKRMLRRLSPREVRLF